MSIGLLTNLTTLDLGGNSLHGSRCVDNWKIAAVIGFEY